MLRLLLAGFSYRAIARHPRVRLSLHGVELAIKRSLPQDAPRVSVVSDQARKVYVMRLGSLLRSAWPKALAGDIKAAEPCRGVLELGSAAVRIDCRDAEDIATLTGHAGSSPSRLEGAR